MFGKAHEGKKKLKGPKKVEVAGEGARRGHRGVSKTRANGEKEMKTRKQRQ